ncbi:MAG: hypothetical protein MI749_20905, partial [Desulfovibrionales bacterium]|nr:hypothetical protein [Desulfovibrionales bacterium]
LGLPAALFQGREPLAFIARLGGGGQTSETLVPISGNGALRAMAPASMGDGAPGELTLATAMDYFQHLYELRHGQSLTRTGPLNEAQYAVMLRALGAEQRLCRELGMPLRVRIRPDAVEALAPLNGVVPLVNENYEPVSPEQVYQRNILNQKRILIHQAAEDAGLDLSSLAPSDPHETALAIIALAETQLADGDTKTQLLRNLGMLERSILNSQDKLRELNRLNELARGPFDMTGRRAVRAPLPTEDSVMDLVRGENDVWESRVSRLSTARECGPWVRNVVEEECQDLLAGRRRRVDLVRWLDAAQPPVRDLALSHLLELYGAHPENPALAGLLASHEGGLISAWETGSLSPAARNIMALGMEQVLMGLDAAPTGTRVGLDPARCRFLLETMTPRAHYLRRGDDSGTSLDLFLDNEEAETTSLARGMEERPGMADQIRLWRADAGSALSAGWTRLETILSTGDLPQGHSASSRTFLTRIYDRETGALMAIGLAVQDPATGEVEILGLAQEGSLDKKTAFRLAGDALLRMVRAIHLADPSARISFTPETRMLAGRAGDLFFTPGEAPSLFTATPAVSRTRAETSLGQRRIRYMEAGLSRMEVLARGLVGEDAMAGSLSNLRTAWEGYQAGDGTAYYGLQAQLAALAARMAARIRQGGGGTEALTDLDMLAAPNQSFQEPQFA